MNSKAMKITITTKSNLFIGGVPTAFEIGGIDQYTAVDYTKYPFIPASSFKRCYRGIIRDAIQEGDSFAIKLKEAYCEYLKFEKKEKSEAVAELFSKDPDTRDEKTTRYEKRYEDACNNASAEYLFGIDGFNNTPKLIFSDFYIKNTSGKIEDLFSVDSKNNIEVNIDGLSANPRTYKTVRPGVSFHGEIRFYKISELEKFGISIDDLEDFIKRNLLKFNEFMYRIGNSKSRGYGKILIDIEPVSKEG